MGAENGMVGAADKSKDSYIFVDVTRVNKAGINMDWNRIPIEGIEAWRSKFIEAESKHCYQTIQRFANPEVVEGEAYISPMYFDLDSDNDLKESLGDARKLKGYFIDFLEIEEGLNFFFSGNRGFHVTAHEDLLRARPWNELSKVLRYMAEQIAHRLTLKTLDRTVYSKRRMWRMTNTQHGKTGLWKIPLTAIEIATLSVDGIKELATAPRILEVGE